VQLLQESDISSVQLAEAEGNRNVVAQTTYSGCVSGNTIKGTMKDGAGERNWEATRQAGSLPPIEGTAGRRESAAETA
jgi:hypothetical protein